MNKFALSVKAKSDLIKIAKYTQITWCQAQRNSYLKILDRSFQLLADDPEIGLTAIILEKVIVNALRLTM